MRISKGRIPVIQKLERFMSARFYNRTGQQSFQCQNVVSGCGFEVVFQQLERRTLLRQMLFSFERKDKASSQNHP